MQSSRCIVNYESGGFLKTITYFLSCDAVVLDIFQNSSKSECFLAVNVLHFHSLLQQYSLVLPGALTHTSQSICAFHLHCCNISKMQKVNKHLPEMTHAEVSRVRLMSFTYIVWNLCTSSFWSKHDNASVGKEQNKFSGHLDKNISGKHVQGTNAVKPGNQSRYDA